MNRKFDNGSDLLRGNTPSLVLAVILNDPAHGYAIVKRIADLSEQGLLMKHGTLYPVLHALERDGLVCGAWEHPESERPRKIFSITEAGRTELARHTSEWKRFASTINSVLGVSFEPG